MNVALAASLAIGGAVIGGIFGFLAGVSNMAQVRALAALDAQRSFRELVGSLEASRVPLNNFAQARIVATGEALSLCVAESARKVYGAK